LVGYDVVPDVVDEYNPDPAIQLEISYANNLKVELVNGYEAPLLQVNDVDKVPEINYKAKSIERYSLIMVDADAPVSDLL
jgi:hypothetical protein